MTEDDKKWLSREIGRQLEQLAFILTFILTLIMFYVKSCTWFE